MKRTKRKTARKKAINGLLQKLDGWLSELSRTFNPSPALLPLPAVERAPRRRQR